MKQQIIDNLAFNSVQIYGLVLLLWSICFRWIFKKSRRSFLIVFCSHVSTYLVTQVGCWQMLLAVPEERIIGASFPFEMAVLISSAVFTGILLIAMLIVYTRTIPSDI